MTLQTLLRKYIHVICLGVTKMKILVTGVAGFIGYHLCKKCIENDFPIIGIDNLNSYYDKNLKINRLEELKSFSLSKKKEFDFKKIDLQDKSAIEAIFEEHKIDIASCTKNNKQKKKMIFCLIN